MAAPKSLALLTESAYCAMLSYPNTTSVATPALLGTLIDTTRAPKFVTQTSMSLLFFKTNSLTGFSLSVVSNLAGSRPETVNLLLSLDEQAENSAMANAAPTNNPLVSFILNVLVIFVINE